jgi:4-carboxymuconolactone decarboxylase
MTPSPRILQQRPPANERRHNTPGRGLMTHKLRIGCAIAVVLGLSASAASAQPAPRFSPLTPDKMTPEQLAIPSVKRAMDAGKYNPSGFDALVLRNPGLSDAFTGVAKQVYPGIAKMSPDITDKPTLPQGLAEIGILVLSQVWEFPAMFASHGPNAVKEGVSQEIVDAIKAGKRPTGMTPEQAATYDFSSELLKAHKVSDATFANLRKYLSERDVVDLTATMGVYTNSLMLLKVSNNDSH